MGINIDVIYYIYQVNLAVQTLSASVANAIKFLRDSNNPDFIGSECTEEFIRLMDRAFDMLNTRNIVTKGFKQALNQSNMVFYISFLNMIGPYLCSITDNNGHLIISSKRKTGFLGIIVSMMSVVSIGQKHITFADIPHAIRFLPTYKLSQDHLELLFNAIRRAGGWNNNPSAKQFAFTYRRLLVRCGVQPGNTGNVIPLAADETEVDHEPVSLPELSTVACNVTSYIAGWIVRNLQAKLDCEECKSALTLRGDSPQSNDDLQLIVIKDNGGLITPSHSVRCITATCEKVIRTKDFRDFDLKSFSSLVFINLTVENLFKELDNHFSSTCCDFDNHKTNLIKQIVKLYFTTRQHHSAKVHTSSLHKSRLRQKLTKTITFCNQ